MSVGLVFAVPTSRQGEERDEGDGREPVPEEELVLPCCELTIVT